MRKAILSVFLAAGLFTLSLSAASPAFATFTISGGSGSDQIIAGMFKHGTDTLAKAWVCVDDGSTGTFYSVGDSLGLTSSGTVYGAGGNDTMWIVSSKSELGPTHCQVSGRSWTELLYHGNFVDLVGDAGNDTLDDGGGAHDTYLFGLADNDIIAQRSSIGDAIGGDGGDLLYGWITGTGDNLNGNAGDDCLWFSDSTFTYGDCGSGGESAGDKCNLTTPTNCEHLTTTCP